MYVSVIELRQTTV